MTWMKLDRLKHKGKTLPQAFFADPDWFFFTMENTRFSWHPKLYSEAQYLYDCARSIRIPQGDDYLVEYNIHPYTGRCIGFDIVPRSRPPHEGATPTVRDNVIDMSFPYRASDYDKQGNRFFVNSLKLAIYGKSNVRMTKARCEEFFENPKNFK